MTHKVLIAEDEALICRAVKDCLQREGYEVATIADGAEAAAVFSSFKPAIVILDVMLPNKSGYQIAQDIRKENDGVPIIFLTAKSQPADVLEGFENGGDDYLKKPFSLDELLARMKALLKRTQQHAGAGLVFMLNAVKFDVVKQQLAAPGQQSIQLTHREAALLQYLAEHKNKPLSKADIQQAVWGTEPFYTSRTLDVFISKLRKCFTAESGVAIINLKGVGYKLLVVEN